MIYVVTTTINVPTFLKDIAFLKDICEEDDNFEVIVIGDVKTPKEARAYCKKLGARYLNIEDQRKAIPEELWDLIPLNTGSRKMIGTYLAYQEGADTVIMMDDDNFPLDGEFIKRHRIVGGAVENCMESESGWFNTGFTVIEKNNMPFYPRGFPWSQRFTTPDLEAKGTRRRVVVNQGLVLGDPDIDAVSRLFWPIEVTAMRPEFEPTFALAPGTWTSFNDQNTAIAREIIPLYFKPPSGGRNADIWAGYVIQRLTEHIGDVVAFGEPLVRHDRNPHDLREDYELEKLNNYATDAFISILRSVKLTKDNYLDALGELLDECFEHFKLEKVKIDVNIKESDHSQYPSEEVQYERNQKANYMMLDFFMEYKEWYNFMKGVHYVTSNIRSPT